MADRNVHRSGDQQKGGGGWSEKDSKNVRAALDGVSDGKSGTKKDDDGKKPQTGALRDIGNALGGNER
jgi:hypothetical protein